MSAPRNAYIVVIDSQSSAQYQQCRREHASCRHASDRGPLPKLALPHPHPLACAWKARQRRQPAQPCLSTTPCYVSPKNEEHMQALARSRHCATRPGHVRGELSTCIFDCVRRSPWREKAGIRSHLCCMHITKRHVQPASSSSQVRRLAPFQQQGLASATP